MSVSTNGQICYGVPLGEDAELPWDNKRWDGDIEDWWRDYNGFKHSRPVFDDKGDYLPGFNDKSDLRWYYDEQDAFDKADPLPFELVNCCSGDCPQWVVAIKDSCKTARRGYPTQFDPKKLAVDWEAVAALKAFLEQHQIEHDPEAFGWYLSSFWG